MDIQPSHRDVTCSNCKLTQQKVDTTFSCTTGSSLAWIATMLKVREFNVARSCSHSLHGFVMSAQRSLWGKILERTASGGQFVCTFPQRAYDTFSPLLCSHTLCRPASHFVMWDSCEYLVFSWLPSLHCVNLFQLGWEWGSFSLFFSIWLFWGPTLH